MLLPALLTDVVCTPDLAEHFQIHKRQQQQQQQIKVKSPQVSESFRPARSPSPPQRRHTRIPRRRLGVYTANTCSQAFRTRLGVSGKWRLVVSSFLGRFTIVSDKALVAGTRNPEKYIAALKSNYVGEEKMHSQLKPHQRFANYLYGHMYRTLAVVGVPLVGGIFAYQSTNHAIARSQQIIYTRIYGQDAVVLLLLGSMALHDYMAKRGRFEEVDGDDDKSLAKF